jgi:hypothetical protein
LPTEERVFIRLDAEGRVVRTPAIERLVVAAAALLADVHVVGDSTRALREALAEVDREAELLGAIAAESSEIDDARLNNLARAPSKGVGVETRKPAAEPRAPGAEQAARPLSPADPGVEDRRCKK